MYRDAHEPTLQRIAELEAEVRALREASEGVDALRAEVRALERELERQNDVRKDWGDDRHHGSRSVALRRRLDRLDLLVTIVRASLALLIPLVVILLLYVRGWDLWRWRP